MKKEKSELVCWKTGGQKTEVTLNILQSYTSLYGFQVTLCIKIIHHPLCVQTFIKPKNEDCSPSKWFLIKNI